VIIADELFKERDNNLSFKKEMESNLKENERLQTLVDEMWQALEQSWNDVKNQKELLERAYEDAAKYKQGMEESKKELDEYIELFDNRPIKGVIVSDVGVNHPTTKVEGL